MVNQRKQILFGGKINQNKEFFFAFEKEKNAVMIKPVKAVKGEYQEIRNRDKTSNDLYSIAMSKIRQLTESLLIG